MSSSGLFIPPSSGVVPPVVDTVLLGGSGGWNDDGDGVVSELGVAGGTFDIELVPAVLEPVQGGRGGEVKLNMGRGELRGKGGPGMVGYEALCSSASGGRERGAGCSEF
eukprot:sb/3477452/